MKGISALYSVSKSAAITVHSFAFPFPFPFPFAAFAFSLTSFTSSIVSWTRVWRSSFLRVNNSTSSAVIVVRPACLAKLSRSAAALTVHSLGLLERGSRGEHTQSSLPIIQNTRD